MVDGTVARRRRLGAWAALFVLAIVVVSTWLAWPQPEAPSTAELPARAANEDPASEETFADVSPIDTASSERPLVPPQRAAATPPALDLPSADTPPRDAVAQLLPLAEKGRADAMRALAMNLVRCQRARGLRDDEQIRNGLVRRFRWRNGHDPSSDGELDGIARDIDSLAADRDRCAGIDDAVFETRLDWLEKAALAGNTDAMLDYADWGLQDMDGYETLLQRFDEVARRRTLAAGFLQHALALGDCRALGVMAESYAGGRSRRNWVFTDDAYLAAVYGEAASLVPGAEPVSSTALDALEGTQQAAAREQAMRLVQRHCGG